MKKYIKACKENEGNPILLCVCRGKYAEGYDFKGDLCRKLYIIGVPNLYSKLPK
jgi:Rad3-related DNA helicase